MSYEAYGIDMSKTSGWKKDFSKIIVDTLIKRNKDFWNEYLEYCEDNELDPNEDNSKDCYVEDFEDPNTLGNDGAEGLIVRSINTEQFHGENIFIYDDYCIFVAAYIPADENAKKIAPTRIDIARMLAEYMNPLLKEPVTIDWLEIETNW